MWRKIERRSEVLSLKKGALLTQDPEIAADIFEIVHINQSTDYITLLPQSAKNRD